MSAPRQRGDNKDIKYNPPKGSRLAKYVAHVDGILRGPNRFDGAAREERAAALKLALHEGATFGELPRRLFREFLVEVPLEIEFGLPQSPREPWAEALLEIATTAILSSMQDERAVFAQPANRRFSSSQLIILATFFRVPSQSQKWKRAAKQNELCHAAAKYLGPGLTDDHIRNVVRRYVQALSRQSELIQELNAARLLQLIEVLETFDDCDRSVREAVQLRGFIRTKSTGTVGVNH